MQCLSQHWCKVNRSESSLIIRSIQIAWVSATPCQVFPSLTPWWSLPSFISRKTQKRGLFRAGVSPGEMFLFLYRSHILTWDLQQMSDVCFGFQIWIVTPIVWTTFLTLISLKVGGNVARSCQRADEAGAPVNISGLTGKSGKSLLGWSWGHWGTDDERSLLLDWLPVSVCECSLCALLKNQTWLNATRERDIPTHQSLLVFLVGPVPLPLPS